MVLSVPMSVGGRSQWCVCLPSARDAVLTASAIHGLIVIHAVLTGSGRRFTEDFGAHAHTLLSFTVRGLKNLPRVTPVERAKTCINITPNFSICPKYRKKKKDDHFCIKGCQDTYSILDNKIFQLIDDRKIQTQQNRVTSREK